MCSGCVEEDAMVIIKMTHYCLFCWGSHLFFDICHRVRVRVQETSGLPPRHTRDPAQLLSRTEHTKMLVFSLYKQRTRYTLSYTALNNKTTTRPPTYVSYSYLDPDKTSQDQPLSERESELSSTTYVEAPIQPGTKGSASPTNAWSDAHEALEKLQTNIIHFSTK